MSIELFGNSATFNPFTGQVNLKRVSDVIVPISETVNFIGQDFVSVDLSFVPTRSSILTLSVEVIDTDGSTIQILTPSIGDGEIQPPTDTQAIWLDTNGYRGTLWINGAYIGKRLKFTGDFQSSVLSGRVYSDVSNSMLLLNKVVLQTAGTYQFTIADTFDFGDLVIPKKATAYEYACTPASGGGGSAYSTLVGAGESGTAGGESQVNIFGNDIISGKIGGAGGTTSNEFQGRIGHGVNGGYGGFDIERPLVPQNPTDTNLVKKVSSINFINPVLNIILGEKGIGNKKWNDDDFNGKDGQDAQIEISFYGRVF